ncbi:DUF6415 family natural product biosynthesis protein [Streptomyces sp. NPDC058001]|uniref:DUF6415 family natural product biosynthesis protein n=1 Tax=Streptomyces sp. NPDC058001 TaxID=3346300 RepID=UPI0036E6E6EE
MATVAYEPVADLSSRYSADDVTAGMLLLGLRRSLAREAVNDELYDDLESVLGEHANLTPNEVPSVAERLRHSTTKLIEIIPHLVSPYPIDEVRRVIALCAEQPQPEAARRHLVRLATAVLTLLDLMGDAAS